MVELLDRTEQVAAALAPTYIHKNCLRKTPNDDNFSRRRGDRINWIAPRKYFPGCCGTIDMITSNYADLEGEAEGVCAGLIDTHEGDHCRQHLHFMLQIDIRTIILLYFQVSHFV